MGLLSLRLSGNQSICQFLVAGLRQVIAYLWSCWDEPVMPVRCHISLRKSQVLHATNDSM